MICGLRVFKIRRQRGLSIPSVMDAWPHTKFVRHSSRVGMQLETGGHFHLPPYSGWRLMAYQLNHRPERHDELWWHKHCKGGCGGFIPTGRERVKLVTTLSPDQ